MVLGDPHWSISNLLRPFPHIGRSNGARISNSSIIAIAAILWTKIQKTDLLITLSYFNK